MTRSHFALALLLLTFAGLYAVVAPTTVSRPPTKARAFFPTAVGTEWVYRIAYTYPQGWREDHIHEEVDVITAVTEKEGGRVITVHHLHHLRGVRAYAATEWYAATSGLSCRGLDENRTGDWIEALPRSVKRGVTWTKDNASDRTRTVSCVVGWENVRVPAAVYESVRVDHVQQTFTRGDPMRVSETITATGWHAPGVGLVKLLIVGQDRRWEIAFELVSFKVGDGVVRVPVEPRRILGRRGGAGQ